MITRPFQPLPSAKMNLTCVPFAAGMEWVNWCLRRRKEYRKNLSSRSLEMPRTWNEAISGLMRLLL